MACGDEVGPSFRAAGRAGSGGRGGSGAGQGGGASGGGGAGVGGVAGSAGAGGGAPATAVKPIVYQLVVRHFGNLSTGRVKDGTIEQNGVGTFDDVNANALGSLKALGVTHVWYTGVLRQATLTDYSALDPRLLADDPDVVKGRAGSFYAVRDAYDVSPDYAVDKAARVAEFERLAARTHAAGLKVLIDLVPNHVARGYGSVVRPEADFGAADDRTRFFSPTNEFFYLPGGQPLALSRPARWQPPGVAFDGAFAPEDGSPGRPPKASGNNVDRVDPGEDDWYETVKLNYGVDFKAPAPPPPGPLPTWQKIDAVIKYWQERGVDGFRCDFAHYVPDEAWRYLIGEAKRRDPGAYFLAEAYDNLGGLLADGFDAVYNDRLYDTVRGMYRGKASSADLRAVLAGLRAEDRPRYASYLENHDECRLPAGNLCDCQKPLGEGCDGPAFYSADAVRQLGPLVYLATDGPVLLYNGQEVGEDGTGDEGFGGEDAHTSIFDYWSLPALQKWANGHAYDGAGLSAEQRALREYYGALLTFAQGPLVRGGGFRELMSDNPGLANVLPFARYDASQPGKLLVVVVNFEPGGAFDGAIKLPADLLDAAGVATGAPKTIKLVFDKQGPVTAPATTPVTREGLASTGFRAQVPNQAGLVYLIE